MTLLVATPAQAAKPGQFKLLGTSMETSSTLVSLPPPGGDLVLARACESCEAVELRLAPDTQYKVNGSKVSFAQFRKAAGGGPHTLYVYYRRDDRTLIRLNLEKDD